MKAVLVDDERKGIEVLQYYLEKNFPEIQVVGTATNQNSVVALIEETDPFVLFLDVNMSSGTTFELFEKTDMSKFKVVFVTAHARYAVDAFKVDAFDYILKPVVLRELERVIRKLRISFREESASKKQKSNLIRLKVSNKHKFVDADDITYVSSEGNYSTVFLVNDKSVMITKNLKKLQEAYFSERPFVRVHQSYIVNIHHVKEFDHSEACLSDGSKVKISKSRYPDFLKKMDELQ